MRAVTISLFGFLLVIAATIISFCDGNSNVLCIESERQALSKFKQHLIDRSNRLSSWVEGEDCCEWVGVFCNNFTGHVKELHLGLHSSSPDIEQDDERDVFSYLDLSDANLTKATDWLQATHKLPSLVELHLSDCYLNNNDPSSISVNYTSLAVLDLSSNMLSSIPTWIFSLRSIVSIDLSSNGVEGVILNGFQNISSLKFLDLSWNSFSSSSTLIWLSNLNRLQFLGLRGVSLQGSLSNFLCNSSTKLEALELLDIESNLLSGEIPDCWENQPKLGVLNLGNNNLTGKIPRSLGSLQNIMSLKLRTNNLFGEVPSTLQHLTYMLILDLSENQLTGSIPAWNGDKLLNLVVLNLRSNKFQAHIPDQICSLNSLHFLDLGYNNISGAIPKCFSNLKPLDRDGLAWVSQERSQRTWQSHVAAVIKFVRESPYRKDTREHWQYEVVESLDLSMNRLHGEIPSSFSNLNFLNHLNLSYNNLTGQIPSGTQLQSFDRFSYIGNHLCGPPITKNCSGGTPGITNGDSSEGRHRSKVNWLYVSIVVGFVMGFWGVVAPLFFIRSWRFAYYKKLEHIGDKLYVFWATIGRRIATSPITNKSFEIRYLDLSDANLTKAINWLQATHKLPSLVELHLSECSLNNNPSPISVNYKYLTVLDLPGNTLSSVPTWTFSLRSLESIDLKSNGVEDVIPNGFQNMSSLEFLDLSWNSSSSSSTLSWLSNLNQLQFLGLRHVGLQGFFQVPLET
ncbi:probable leucine-rich repeat receptor-like protein kinase At1g35710 [Durio zibethinus]|uniref:Probable leucine-rich repeat receptor-like protein kinase At1g35710 n=1 Tax=Durio zibethinus TaxID=66656 RepID=A0A6P5Z1U6_DURZI|nr:probable leucine-rich repeat receptor-like protein kinase At1g35710 [Durio zibethinus]